MDTADAGRAGLVIGVDLGTTSTKAVAYDAEGNAAATSSVAYELREPCPGYAEQDPAEILAAVLETLRQVVAAADRPVEGVSFSSAMHSLLGLDEAGTPYAAWVASTATCWALWWR